MSETDRKGYVGKLGRMYAAIRDLQTLFELGVMGGRSDGELLDRFVERREGTVFGAIVHRHGPMVWGVCRRVLRDDHDAEDAFQATFLVLARKASSVVPREKLGNWLYGVAYQSAMKARAMRAKRRVRERPVSDMPEPEAASHDLRDHLTELLDRELSRLPEKYRMPVVLCDLEGRTHKEAASQLGWPIGTVSSRLSRARSMLAKRLAQRGLSLSVGSLALLVSQESASASMPTKLIGSTARAASQFAVGGAVTAGVVPAELAALTGEVMNMMLLSKIKVVTAMLPVVSALAVGGTGLAFRAQADEPTGQKDDLQGRIDQKREELQRLIEEQKRRGHGEGQQQRTRDDPGPSKAELSPYKQQRQKEYVDAMRSILKDARAKTLEQLDELIQAKEKDLEELRWSVYVAEGQVARLKKLRDAPRTEEKTPFRTHGAVGP